MIVMLHTTIWKFLTSCTVEGAPFPLDQCWIGIQVGLTHCRDDTWNNLRGGDYFGLE